MKSQDHRSGVNSGGCAVLGGGLSVDRQLSGIKYTLWVECVPCVEYNFVEVERQGLPLQL